MTSQKADHTAPARPALEFAFGIDLTLEPPVILGGGTADAVPAATAIVQVADGRIDGPRLRGRVVPGSGGDWARVRSDGVLEFNARYLLEAEDGTVIALRSRGYRWGPPEVMLALARGEPADPTSYYMRITPTFEVRPGPHEWLARHVFLGTGRKTADGNHIDYHVVA